MLSGRSDAVLEAPAIVACLDDVAVMREAIKQGRGHLGVSKDGGPFSEGEIGGDHYGGALVELADQMEHRSLPAIGSTFWFRRSSCILEQASERTSLGAKPP
jgi:hypothetical protein